MQFSHNYLYFFVINCPQVSQVNTNETRNIAQETYDKAKENLMRANASLIEVNNLFKEVKEFSDRNDTKKDIKNVTEQIFAMKIDIEPHEITNMANKIKEAVQHLTDIDPIIEATKDDLRRVNALKENAEYARFIIIILNNTNYLFFVDLMHRK